MDRIFISYRRADTMAETDKIYDRLVARFGLGQVFRDVDSIVPGEEFPRRLREELKKCKVQLVVIGRKWLTIEGEDGQRRLEAKNDFVRLEVEAALHRNIRIIPLLINDTPMPAAAQLPESLSRLARTQKFDIHMGLRFETDLDRLIALIERIPDFAPPTTIATMRSDMDQALADELAELGRRQRAGQGGHVAINGRPIGMTEGVPLYEFEVEGLWEPQEDTPLGVVVPERQNVTATLVTTTGSRVTISASEELPGAALKKIRLIPDTSGLIEALRAVLGNTDETVSLLGAKTFRLVPAITGFESFMPRAFPGTPPQFPDDTQRRAMEAALGNEVVYIVGPPGTGKTQTLAAIAYAHLLEGRTVLIAAHTNIAVDNAMLELAKICKGRTELEEGRVLRYGAPKLKEVRDNECIYPPKIAARLGLELEQKKREIEESLSNLEKSCAAEDERIRQAEIAWMAERQRMAAALRKVNGELQALQNADTRRKQDDARRLAQVDRVIAKAEGDLHSGRAELAELAGSQAKLSQLRERQLVEVKRTEELLRRALGTNAVLRWIQGIDLQALQRRLAEFHYGLHTYDSRLQALSKATNDAHERRDAIEQRLEQFRAARSLLEQEQLQVSPAMQQIGELEEQAQQLQLRIGAGDDTVRREVKTLQDRRAQMHDQMQKLRSQAADIAAELASIEKQLVEKARVIGTTLTKTYMGAATRDRRFDAIIIDEASIAPMPAVYVVASRANEFVTIVGDPCQLAPIARAETAAAKAWLRADVFGRLGITIKKAAEGSKDAVLLDTQFRMHPSISSIPRLHVYQDYLKDAARDWQLEQVNPKPTFPLVLCDTGSARPMTSKPPFGGKFNEYHALCSVSLIETALVSLSSTASLMVSRDSDQPLLGVVTPYRAQAQRIQALVKKSFKPSMAALVRVGTIHSFQGLQFDVLIFDTVESPPARPFFIAGAWGTDAMRLVNVAVTRPKHKLIIVANVGYLRKTLGQYDTLRLALGEVPENAVVDSRDLVDPSAPSRR